MKDGCIKNVYFIIKTNIFLHFVNNIVSKFIITFTH